ncbi:MAG: transaldolase [Dermatophilaceae bacterium]
MADPLAELTAAGVSIWLDDLTRDRLTSGGLATLVRDKHVTGVTSNPTIFQAAVAAGTAYDEQIGRLAQQGKSAEEIVFAFTTDDVRDACDVLRPVAERTDGVDGRVSIEVDPRLARDSAGTLDQVRALHATIDRPNLFVKIPATAQGLPAIAEAIAAGISVNVTLIFGLDRYRAVMNSYLDGLEHAHAAGLDLGRIHSVASFFVSRVDTEVDKRLAAVGTPLADRLKGQAGLANARLAYQAYEEVFATPRWRSLADEGARPQRPLWASTGVKDTAYPDTMYVTELVAPGTVNTMPEKTLDAVADHGVVRGDTVRGRYAAAQATLDGIEALGISYTEVVEVLERQGVDKFEASWQGLLADVREQMSRSR